MNAGDTFIPARFDNHLWVIVSDPAKDVANVVISNFTTFDGTEEESCVVNNGEHPFVRHKTVVRYRDAKTVSANDLKTLVKKGQLKPHMPLSAEILDRVRQGAGQSDFLPEQCRKILSNQGLI